MLIPASTYDYLKENAKRMSLAENGIEIQANYTEYFYADSATGQIAFGAGIIFGLWKWKLLQ